MKKNQKTLINEPKQWSLSLFIKPTRMTHTEPETFSVSGGKLLPLGVMHDSSKCPAKI